jgi:hypothetical protein
VTGSGEREGLVAYIIPEFQSQGDVPLQHDICSASVIPGELPAVAFGVGKRILKALRQASNQDRRGSESAAKAISPKARGQERLEVGPSPEIAHVIDREKTDATIAWLHKAGCRTIDETVRAR